MPKYLFQGNLTGEGLQGVIKGDKPDPKPD